MTMPLERRQAVNRTRQFLIDLMDPKKTPRIPKTIREQAYRCLKHYPNEYTIDEPDSLFADWDANHDGEWGKAE